MTAEKRRPAAAASTKQPAKRRKLSNDTVERNLPQTKPSILSKEQPAFPRGGAGALTTLERKQIRAQAAQDVAREQKTDDLFGASHTQPQSSGDSDQDLPVAEAKAHVPKKSRKSKKATKSTQQQDASDTVRIESLTHKKLVEGQLLLGCISSINSLELTVSLPNNLVGYVPLTNICDQFTRKVEHVLQKASVEDRMEVDDDAEDDDDDEQIDLAQHFKIGQYLRVAVASLSEDQPGKTESRRKLILSIDPQKANSGLSRTNVAEGSFVQAAVSSIEDHGVVVDIGLGDKASGFIPHSKANHDLTTTNLLPGSVLLCYVVANNSSGKIVQLSSDLASAPRLPNAASVDNFLPGTSADILITEVSEEGLVGKIMGMLDATADVVHSGSYKDKDAFLNQFRIGQKLCGRLLATFPQSENRKLAFSVLDCTMALHSQSSKSSLEPSTTISDVRVVRVVSRLGVYLDLGDGAVGFAHVSRLSDKTIETLGESSGTFKIGSEHKARILDYNPVDDLYIVSLQKSILEQPFLRYADVQIGQVVKAEIEKVLIGEHGVRSLAVRLAPTITGLISPLHFADVVIKQPEKKFKEGMTVSARVLSVDVDQRQIHLTLKKSLINSDQPIWSVFNGLSVGDSSVGTLIKLDPKGALMQFFGSVKGYLPVSEMSEAYIKDATEHFSIGQVLAVTAIKVDTVNHRLTVSARDQTLTTSTDLSQVQPGLLCDGIVFENSKDDLLVRLQPSGIAARLSLDHAADGTEKARRKALDAIRVGQTLKQLVILEVQKQGRLVAISNKPSLRQAVEKGTLLSDFEMLKEDAIYTGFVSNITEAGVFVRFAAGITGFIKKSQLPEQQQGLPEFDLRRSQSITARVQSIDYSGATPRFWLTLREQTKATTHDKSLDKRDDTDVFTTRALENAIDDEVKTVGDLAVGTIINVQITSVKDTQLNVEIAKGVQGRIDVSEAFDTIEDITDRKHPLKQFSSKQVLKAKILGAHDTRTHRFLPLSHRSSKNVVYELSVRPSILNAAELNHLQLSDVEVGQAFTVFVNNIMDNALMVNVTPAIRGRIRASEVSDDLGLATNLARNFPIGSAIKTRVAAVDAEKNWLDLSARTSSKNKISLDSINVGDVLPGRVTKITERTLILQLSDELTGVVELVDMSDDFDQADPTRYQRNEIIRACVIEVDQPNKKIYLSTRPSRILGADPQMKDPEIKSIDQCSIGDVRRGFVNTITDKGVFIKLSRTVTAFVRITNLSDDYVKEWKEIFQRDQLVTGKIIAVDTASGHLQLSLRKSHVAGDYRPPVAFGDLSVGDVVVAKVAQVETFGVFIVVNNSENIRGLCHRSEIADKRVEDVRKLGFAKGDPVKAKVLRLEPEQRRVNFGMKASYFIEDGDDLQDEVNGENAESETEDVSMSDDEGVELPLNTVDSGDELNDDARSDSDGSTDDDTEEQDSSEDSESEPTSTGKPKGLSAGGFNWDGKGAGATLASNQSPDGSDLEDDRRSRQPKRKKIEVQIDRTGALDAEGPQSADDFERLLLGEREPLQLWLKYMAFHIELGDIDQARVVGKRALGSFKLGQEANKTEIWSALLNLENAFGDEQSTENTFKQATEVCDQEDIYNRLASIYILSGKKDKADSLFQEMLQKLTQDPKLWVNYATFLFDKMEDPARARALLPRALQALPPFTHFDITSKFARLEFTTKTGVPEEGRTRYQGLVNLYPKKLDVFNVMIDLEAKLGDYDQVRSLFQQVLERKLKPKQASSFFKKWIEFERGHGDDRKVEEVEARAAKWVAKYKKESA